MKEYDTRKVMNFVEKKYVQFNEDEHQDCHEFMLWTFNHINDYLIKLSKSNLPFVS